MVYQYLHTNICHKNQPNAGKYTSPMDVMGNATCVFLGGICQPDFSTQTGGPPLVKEQIPCEKNCLATSIPLEENLCTS